MNIEEIKELAHLIQETGLSEIEVEEKGIKLRIVGARPIEVHAAPPQLPPAMPMTMTVAPSTTPEQAAAPAAPKAPGKKEAEEEQVPSSWKAIESPMVGTFYRSPAPEADSYVEVGDKVKPDTVLCIVEAMKLMNEIKAECSGTVRKVLVENSQPVEFGQPMFYIEPA